VLHWCTGSCSYIVAIACSNEIAGDGRVPHWCIGSSRRVMVQQREQQHEVLLEAVQNLNPDVVICDEIGNLKVLAARRPPCLYISLCS
jgi:stage III sporulation protein SpoIIIAA